jgi:aspartate-semialdehyde dehydrogenase
MKIAIVGATGLVGKEMINGLLKRNFPFTDLLLVASEKSVGKKINIQGKEHTIIGMQEAIAAKADIALFSAGGSTSLEYAEKFAKAGTRVIDNSSAWRMDPNKKLIIPEINGDSLTADDFIIANPNCSTIQMLVALAPLHQKFHINRLIVSTYQSITGTGVKAVKQLEDEMKGIDGEKAYPHPIHKNCIPQCDDFTENGYTKEEMKLVNESQKILAEPNLKVTATAVRVPVIGGHSESINVSFDKPFKLNDIKAILEEAAGVQVVDDPSNNVYPMPINSHQKDEVFVGRIREDFSFPNSLNLWVVADNLRKGAATNAIQIAEKLIEKNFVK